MSINFFKNVWQRVMEQSFNFVHLGAITADYSQYNYKLYCIIIFNLIKKKKMINHRFQNIISSENKNNFCLNESIK